MRQLSDVVRRILPEEPAEEKPRLELVRPEVIEAPAIRVPLSARAPHRGYLARELVQCTFPHNDPKTDVYIRKDGNYRLMIESGADIDTGEKFGLPYGTLPRLLMLYVTGEAVRKQGTEDELKIEFGESMNDFLRNVGCNPATGGGKRGDAARIRVQHRRLFNARFTFARIEGDEACGNENRKPMEITDEIHSYWDNRNPAQGSLWESYVLLTKRFQETLITSPVPFDLEHLKRLKRSALAIDLYCWLTYRLYRANGKGFTVPYSALQQQFGTGYTRERAFRQAMAEELVLVAEVYPQLRYEFTPRGLAVDAISRRDLPVPSETKLVRAEPPRHGAPQSERPYNTTQLVVMGTDLQRIDRLARKLGKSLDEVMPLWRAWCIEERIYPKNVAAHLTDFVKNHDPYRYK